MLGTTVWCDIYMALETLQKNTTHFMDTHTNSKSIKYTYENNKHQIQGRRCFWVTGLRIKWETCVQGSSMGSVMIYFLLKRELSKNMIEC